MNLESLPTDPSFYLVIGGIVGMLGGLLAGAIAAARAKLGLARAAFAGCTLAGMLGGCTLGGMLGGMLLSIPVTLIFIAAACANPPKPGPPETRPQ